MGCGASAPAPEANGDAAPTPKAVEKAPSAAAPAKANSYKAPAAAPAAASSAAPPPEPAAADSNLSVGGEDAAYEEGEEPELDYGLPPYGGLALATFDAESEKELAIQDGEQILVLADYQDGWVLGKKCDSHEMGLVPKTYLERVELEPVVVTEDFATDDARTLAVKKGERLAVVGQLPCDDPNVVPWALVIRPATGEAAEDGYWYCHPGYCPSNVLAAVAKLDVLATHEAEAEGELTVYEGEGSYVWLLPGGDDKMSVVLDRRGATGTVPKAKLSAPPPEPAPVVEPTSPDVKGSTPAKKRQVQKQGSFAMDSLMETTRQANVAIERKNSADLEAEKAQKAIADAKAKAAEEAAKKEAQRASAAEGDAAAAKAAAAAAEAAEAAAQEGIKAAEAKAAEAQRRVAEMEAQAAKALEKAAEAERRAKEAMERAEAKEKEAASGAGAMKEQLEALQEQLGSKEMAMKAAEMKAKQMEGQWVAEMTKRRELHNQLQDMVGSLRVACRVRPIKGDETAITIKQDGGADPKVVINYMGPGDKPAEKSFDFTHVYGPKSTQEQVFKDSAELMTSVLDGYNVCIFAYGQSGSGKTHTMDGSKEMPGLAPRAMERLFEVIKERDSASKHEVFISMLEIYNERIRDLLGDGKKQKEMNFSVQKDEVIGMMCPGLTSTGITDKEGAATAIALGNTNRSVGATNLNEQSSRSHMIVTLTVFSTSKVNGAQHVGKLSLVDLAGSERLEKTGAGDDPERMKEAQAINKSLSALGTVIAALAANEKHVPYRDSKLTHLLADSLGGNSKTLMLVACRGEPDNAPETINSLTFAARAKAVKLGKATQRAAPKGPAKAKK